MFESGRVFSVTGAIAIGAAVAVPLLAGGVYLVIRARRKPRDKERQRRLTVNLEGRLGDATITEVSGNTIFYDYSVRGVAYTASQDIAQLRERVPENPDQLIGRVASLKYSPQNPANSILLCEEWSGLRLGTARRVQDAVS